MNEPQAFSLCFMSKEFSGAFGHFSVQWWIVMPRELEGKLVGPEYSWICAMVLRANGLSEVMPSQRSN